MRVWVRVVLTLALTPLLWGLAGAYVANNRGAAWADLLPVMAASLPGTVLVYSLLALPLLLLLVASDAILGALGISLLTLVASPVLAALAAAGALYVAEGPALGWDGLATLLRNGFWLFVLDGVVWGLTIREPRGGRPARRRGPAAAAPPTA